MRCQRSKSTTEIRPLAAEYGVYLIDLTNMPIPTQESGTHPTFNQKLYSQEEENGVYMIDFINMSTPTQDSRTHPMFNQKLQDKKI